MIRLDSRQCQPGDSFIGDTRYHRDARDRGATILPGNLSDLYTLAKRHRQTLRGIVIAIVGSFGKTTTKDALATVLSPRYKISCTADNQNNELGAPLTLLNANHDDAFVIVELGIRKPDQMPYLQALTQPDWVVLTGFGPVHREFFDSDRAIAIEKLRILSHSTTRLWATTNIRYTDDISATASAYGIQCHWVAPDTQSLVGAISDYVGITPRQQNQQQPGSVYQSRHRLAVSTKGPLRLIDDTYNANPDAVRYALDYAATFNQKLIVILGDMAELGPDALSYHQAIIDHLATYSVMLAIVTGEIYAKTALSTSQHQCYYAKDNSEIITLFNQYVYNQAGEYRPQIAAGVTVLIKGSRSMQLDRLVTAIQQMA